MNSQIIQLLVLAAIAVFLILRLRDVLGTRDGFEDTENKQSRGPSGPAVNLQVIEGRPDPDIVDNIDPEDPAVPALEAMKRTDRDFSITEFLEGAKGAYEMILMAFENGELADVQPFLSEDVYGAFAGVVEDRASKGLTIEANFIGVREMAIKGARMDSATKEAEIDIRFVSNLTSAVRDNAGDIIEGSTTVVKTQKDVWTFSRDMDADNPNWTLVATG